MGRGITRASNTQNRIDARNFVALDPEQERIRTELLLDKINYEFREGEPLESLVDGFEFIEAVTTLACASNEISYVAMAKGYVGGLYQTIEGPPYKALFNSSTSASRLWNLVKLARRIDRQMKSSYDQSSSTERGIVVHGNRLMLHLTFRRLSDVAYDLLKGDEISDKTLTGACKSIMKDLSEIIDGQYTGAYLAPLFKNVGKCTNIRDESERRRTARLDAKTKLLKGPKIKKAGGR